jgi:hypothetical protein
MNEHSLNKNGPALAVEQAALGASGVPARQEAPLRAYAKEPFEADRMDGIFALFAFVLGFYFARWVLFSWQGWGVTLFTLGFCGAVTAYLLKKRGAHFPGRLVLAGRGGAYRNQLLSLDQQRLGAMAQPVVILQRRILDSLRHRSAHTWQNQQPDRAGRL